MKGSLRGTEPYTKTDDIRLYFAALVSIDGTRLLLNECI